MEAGRIGRGWVDKARFRLRQQRLFCAGCDSARRIGGFAQGKLVDVYRTVVRLDAGLPEDEATAGLWDNAR